jgi:hypothetical protein
MDFLHSWQKHQGLILDIGAFRHSPETQLRQEQKAKDACMRNVFLLPKYFGKNVQKYFGKKVQRQQFQNWH